MFSLSIHVRHLHLLPILTAAAYTATNLHASLFFTFQPPPPFSSSTTYPHGGSLDFNQTPRLLVFHFPTTTAIFFFYYLSSRGQRTLPPTSAPSCFSISNHVMSSSGTKVGAYTATNLRAFLLFTFQPRQFFFRHSHLCYSPTCTAITSLAT